MNPSFSPASLKAFEPSMKQHFDRFILGIEKMASQNSGVVEMSARFHNLSLDVEIPVNMPVDAIDCRVSNSWCGNWCDP